MITRHAGTGAGPALPGGTAAIPTCLLLVAWTGAATAPKAGALTVGAPADIIALKCKCRPILKAAGRKIGMKWKWKF